MLEISGVDELEWRAGTNLGRSRWHTVAQRQIDMFADATGDHQWIHVDRARAATGPFGATIAHGYLTLSLVPKLTWEVYRIDRVSAEINYGCDRVRFPTPVVEGSRIMAEVDLLTVEKTAAGFMARTRVVVHLEGADKPACVAEPITLVIP